MKKNIIYLILCAGFSATLFTQSPQAQEMHICEELVRKYDEIVSGLVDKHINTKKPAQYFKNHANLAALLIKSIDLWLYAYQDCERRHSVPEALLGSRDVDETDTEKKMGEKEKLIKIYFERFKDVVASPTGFSKDAVLKYTDQCDYDWILMDIEKINLSLENREISAWGMASSEYLNANSGKEVALINNIDTFLSKYSRQKTKCGDFEEKGEDLQLQTQRMLSLYFGGLKTSVVPKIQPKTIELLE